MKSKLPKNYYHCNDCNHCFEIMDAVWNKDLVTACPVCSGTENIEELNITLNIGDYVYVEMFNYFGIIKDIENGYYKIDSISDNFKTINGGGYIMLNEIVIPAQDKMDKINLEIENCKEKLKNLKVFKKKLEALEK